MRETKARARRAQLMMSASLSLATFSWLIKQSQTRRLVAFCHVVVYHSKEDALVVVSSRNFAAKEEEKIQSSGCWLVHVYAYPNGCFSPLLLLLLFRVFGFTGR
jgi:hypothetical protein